MNSTKNPAGHCDRFLSTSSFSPFTKTLPAESTGPLSLPRNGPYAARPARTRAAYRGLIAAVAVAILSACGSEDDGPLAFPDGEAGGGGSTIETYAVGGTVGGLWGTGLTLQNNGGDDLTISGDGTFAFDTAVTSGDDYAVTVLTQPGDPAQTCAVSNGSGTVNDADITDVGVTCTTNEYSITGSVTGLQGTGLTLQNNAGDDLTVAADGTFTFNTAVASGESYAVTVLTPPSGPAQSCSVSNSSGTVNDADITNVGVTCTTNEYTIGGSVTGLEGAGLTLQNNAGDDLTISGNGTFAFATAVASGGSYEVTVFNHPLGPAQACTVTNGSGTVNDADITDVGVTCITNEYTIGGSVTGLAGTGLTLQNNAGDDLAVAADGTFTFSIAVASGEGYAVTVLAQPSSPGQTCSVTGGSGTVADADITDVSVGCVTNPVLTATSDIMQMHLSWDSPDTVDILYSSDRGCDWDNYTLCANSGMLVDQAGGQLTLGAVADGFDSDTGWYFVADTGSARSNRVGARPAAPGIPGVRATTISGGRLYVGGSFTRVSPVTGGGALLTADTGRPTGVLPVLTLTTRGGTYNGEVYAALPDGAGGWYIGGRFSEVGGYPRANLARVRADGSVDPDWNPGANHAVEALATDSIRVYAGGSFTSAGGQVRNYLAAFDAVTGGVDPDWDPGMNDPVTALAVADGRVYAGGIFTSAGGQTRNRLAAFDLATGVVDSDWNPGADSTVYAVTVDGGRVYAGGGFTSAGGQARNRLAAFDAVTGVVDPDWNPGTNHVVFDLTVDGSRVYAGGNFTAAGGQTRDRLAAFDAITGVVDPDWNPGANHSVRALTVDGSRVYAGGYFTVAGGQTRDRLAAFDAMTGAVDSDWNPGATNLVLALSVDGGRVYAGGGFTSAAGVIRHRLAAFDVATGVLDPDWNPGANQTVLNLTVVDGARVYAGGYFTAAGGQTRNYLAAFDVVTGAVDPDWNPGASHYVHALTVDSGRVYAGGGFTSADGQTRNYLAAFDAVTGVVDPDWNPGANTSVKALTVDGGRVYAGGSFTAAGGQTRNYLAAFDAVTGVVDADWNPGADRQVDALTVANGRVYAGGNFSAAGGQTRNRLAAFDAITGVVDPDWNPGANHSVRALTVDGSRVYAGGQFTSVGGQTRDRLAAFDAVTGVVDADWAPGANNRVHALTLNSGWVYAGGYFTSSAGQVRYGLAVFDATTGELVW